MPAESIAIALPGAFMACVQCFELVQVGRNFKGDLAVSIVELDMCEIHLMRWGTAAGLDQEGDATKLPEKLSKYQEAELQKATLVLKRIAAIFNDTKAASQLDSMMDGDDKIQPEAETQTGQSASQDTKLQKSQKYVSKIKANYLSAVRATKGFLQSASDRTKWAIYKKKHLTALVEGVSKMIDHLEDLFPELLEAEEKLAEQEVQDADKEVIQSLPAIAAEIDPLMAQALTVQMKSYGMTFEDVEAGDYVRVHLGNKYAPGEKSTGHDDHEFKKLRFTGFAEFHGGNVYGDQQKQEISTIEGAKRSRQGQS